MAVIGVLCVAEKPSLAASIAKFLSHGSSVQRRSHQDVHEFNSKFLGQPANVKVTSVIGHVYNADFPDGPYQDWCACLDALRLILAVAQTLAARYTSAGIP